jgi:pyruvate/2-oxoglutarate dehydrogenase complex dihydrolipoamide acyltransferase (E2) component
MRRGIIAAAAAAGLAGCATTGSYSGPTTSLPMCMPCTNPCTPTSGCPDATAKAAPAPSVVVNVPQAVAPQQAAKPVPPPPPPAAPVAPPQPRGNGESLDKDQLLKLTPSQRAAAREHGALPSRAPAAAPMPAGPSEQERLAHVDPRDEIVPMSPLRKRVAERLVQAQHFCRKPLAASRRYLLLIQSNGLAAVPFRARAAAGVIHQQASHHFGSHAEELRPILPLYTPLIDKF